jgi:aspartate aminotransferase
MIKMVPELSEYFKKRKPSAIRLAQIKFAERKDKVTAINTAIGNVTLPMHPAMQKRMFELKSKQSPFCEGVVKYSATVGEEEANKAVLNIIASSGFDTSGLYSQITNGGSQAMELVILGACGKAGSNKKPLLLIDPAYTNYNAMAERTGRSVISVARKLEEDGRFSLPDFREIEKAIIKNKPGAIVVIPYDNPTGQFLDQQTMIKIANLCVKHNMWMISDEAYREMYYIDSGCVSIWSIKEKDVKGIEGRRISIESASKVWNACGLRIGALVTDNKEFHEKAVAESTADLCSNTIGQYIFGALAHESHADLKKWYVELRRHYKPMLFEFTTELKRALPNVIVSLPEAAIYSVIDVRNIVNKNFDSAWFVEYCATKGSVIVNGKKMTLLVAPMSGFYNVADGEENPGRTQMRIAYVETPERMKLVPKLFAELLDEYHYFITNSTNKGKWSEK